jgi:hypothetical protein
VQTSKWKIYVVISYVVPGKGEVMNSVFEDSIYLTVIGIFLNYGPTSDTIGSDDATYCSAIIQIL